jgi:hypothetical protein
MHHNHSHYSVVILWEDILKFQRVLQDRQGHEIKHYLFLYHKKNYLFFNKKHIIVYAGPYIIAECNKLATTDKIHA